MAGTTLFGLMAGLYYWWPKIAHRMYNHTIGLIGFLVSFVGFNILYFPYFYLMSMPRRVDTYSASSGLSTLNFAATVGAYIFGAAVVLSLANLLLSLTYKPITVGNPWNAQESEWTGNYKETPHWGSEPVVPESDVHVEESPHADSAEAPLGS